MIIPRLLIYLIMVFALFGGLMTTLGMPKYFTVATELIIVVLFLIIPFFGKSKRLYVIHLWYVFFYMILIAITSTVANGSDMQGIMLSLRLLFRFYFFYLAINTLALDDDTIKKFNVFTMTLVILQLPVVAYKFYLYGLAEITMGAYAERGGALTTMLPIVVIFYLASYYFLYEARLKYIILAIGFVLFSIVGKKRAVAFLYPIQFLLIYNYIYIKGRGAQLGKKAVGLVLVLSVIVIVTSSILHFNPTLNPESQLGGTVDPEYALDFAKEYTTKENPLGYTTGRYSTTIRIFEGLSGLGLFKLFLGLGPGSLTQSIFDPAGQRERISAVMNKLRVKYGMTGMTRIAVEYGVLGVVTFSLLPLMFAHMSMTYYKYEVDPYWRAFAAGSVCFAFSMVFFFFAYGDAAFWGDTLPVLYFYSMAVVYTRLRRIGGIATGTKRYT